MSFTPIGVTDWRNQRQLFGIKELDRLGHIYCIGRTGSGKSTLLLNMVIADIAQGRGVGVIDPHGDLADELLHYIPKQRVKDVFYFNAGDANYPIAFNPLFAIKEHDRYLVVATIVTTLKKIFSESWGPRLEHILRHTLLSLSYYSKSTLLDIVPMLTNPEFRRQVLYAVSDRIIIDFWKKEFEPLSPQLRNEFISPIINKVGLFIAHPLIRNILGQHKSTLSVSDIMDTQKIFIANLSKGILGEAGTQLLGALLVTQFQTASLGRESRPASARTPFYLYIDEVHSFITKSLADVLSESRKYGLALFLTHQFLDQLSEDIQKSILGNVGTLISFRVGIRDAKILADEFFPLFDATDLINLPSYHIYLRILIDGTVSKPFSALTLPLPKREISNKEEVIRFSRNAYSRDLESVLEDISEKMHISKPEHSLFINDR